MWTIFFVIPKILLSILGTSNVGIHFVIPSPVFKILPSKSYKESMWGRLFWHSCNSFKKYYFQILFCIYCQNAWLQKQNPSLNDLFWKTPRGVRKSERGLIDHDWAICISWWVGRESGPEKRQKQACREKQAKKNPSALHITVSTNEDKQWGIWHAAQKMTETLP